MIKMLWRLPLGLVLGLVLLKVWFLGLGLIAQTLLVLAYAGLVLWHLRTVRVGRAFARAAGHLTLAVVVWHVFLALALVTQALVLLLVVGAGGWLLWQRHDRPAPAVQSPQRQPMNPELRRAIIARDDSICGICRFPVTDPRDIHIDHIHPVHAGGDDDPDNLQTAHADCNRRKGGVVGWQPPYRRV